MIAETHDNEEQESVAYSKEETQGGSNNDVELQEDTDTEYINDEQNREEETHEQPV